MKKRGFTQVPILLCVFVLGAMSGIAMMTLAHKSTKHQASVPVAAKPKATIEQVDVIPVTKKVTNCKLPEGQRERTLADMKIGETAWTMPWGMWVDNSGRCWLNPNYPAEKTPGGTVELKVERRGDSFHVTNHDPTHKWTPEKEPCYSGHTMDDWLPVAKFTNGEPLNK